MNVLRRLGTLATAFALLAAPFAAAGCGNAGAKAPASIQPGDMPTGGAWTGVYFSPLYGYLHIVQDGNAITGKWERPTKEKWGQLKGTVVGDLMHFEWTEHITGLVGPNAAHKGKGYFKYKRPPGDNVDDDIVGEIGRDNDETGEPWDAVKQRHMDPNLASIGGTGSGDVGGGDWDSDNKEKGTPEGPKSPPPP
jgi:hypothetical protein